MFLFVFYCPKFETSRKPRPPLHIIILESVLDNKTLEQAKNVDYFACSIGYRRDWREYET
jgi:hypothetical protein